MIACVISNCCSERVKVCYVYSTSPARIAFGHLFVDTGYLHLGILILLISAVGSIFSRAWSKYEREEIMENKKHTLAILELDIIFIINACLISSCKRNIFIVWWRNAWKINSGKWFYVKGMCMIIHRRQIHWANSKINGPKRHFCVNHCNAWKQEKKQTF